MVHCDKIPSMAFLINLIQNEVPCVYDSKGGKIDIPRLMHTRFGELYNQVRDGKLFYDPIDLY